MNYQNRNLIVKGESEDKGNLWLGDYDSARNKRHLKNDRISTVVTAGLGMKITYNSQFKHKILPLYDSQAENITRYFQSSYQFIDEGLKNGNVLIHCYAGISRSTTILAAYLMRKNQWGTKETLSMIRKLRFVIEPNRGFMMQLRKFQKEISYNKIDKSGNMQLTQSKVIKSNQNIQKSTVSSSKGNNFVEGFLNYKRDNSLVSKNRSSNIYQSKIQQRSKTMAKKQILVTA